MKTLKEIKDELHKREEAYKYLASKDRSEVMWVNGLRKDILEQRMKEIELLQWVLDATQR